MSAFNENGKIWKDGMIIPWKEAKIHIASHVVHYGTSCFEGLRAYENSKGTAVFRLDAHTQRLYNSCKMYRMEIPYSQDEFNQAIIDTIKANGFKSCYIRPVVYRGYGALGVDPFSCPLECAVLAWEWGSYLGEEAMESGVEVCVSTWRRMAPDTFPALAKAGGHYMNSQLIKMEANLNGYVEGIALNPRGHVSEGSGENIFLVIDKCLITPPLASSVLPGITRNCVKHLAKELNIPVEEQAIPRELLYVADEVFFTGSAAEITPIRTIDKIPIGEGKRGPVTKQLQEEFFSHIKAEKEDKFGWLTYI